MSGGAYKPIKTIVPPALSDDNKESIGPLSDHNETVRNERDATINSPPKDGAHTTSSVSTTSSSLIYYKYANSCHILGHGESQSLQNDKSTDRQTTRKERPKGHS